MKTIWRQGSKIPINVYEGDRPVCQCQTAADARRIVQSVNFCQQMQALDRPEPKRGRPRSQPRPKAEASLLEGAQPCESAS